tara:strand:+ start:294 stop:1028 length:735 start_codon:yes stop_codon:yes gene_type:complete
MEDISRILNNWEFNPEDICARKVEGVDGREKLQVRVDLGMLQMELEGRPDGTQPNELATLLEYYEKKAEDPDFVLGDDDCEALGQEGLQFYHRYICLLRLGDFDRVISDTNHNLAIFDLVAKHSKGDEQKMMFEQYRPYVTMVNTRARGELRLLDDDYDGAIAVVDRGIERIQQLLSAFEDPDLSDDREEVHALEAWRQEITENRPISLKQRLAEQLQEAIADEKYERAAVLRDRLRGLEKNRL